MLKPIYSNDKNPNLEYEDNTNITDSGSKSEIKKKNLDF